jgi:hypothetical protein
MWHLSCHVPSILCSAHFIHSISGLHAGQWSISWSMYLPCSTVLTPAPTHEASGDGWAPPYALTHRAASKRVPLRVLKWYWEYYFGVTYITYFTSLRHLPALQQRERLLNGIERAAEAELSEPHLYGYSRVL